MMTQPEDTGSSMSRSPRIAVYAGSFNPFTAGHKDIADRAAAIFDRLVIAVGNNISKQSAITPDQRASAIAKIYAGNPTIETAVYSGATASYARTIGARWLVRGIRNAADLDSEMTLAEVNRRISGIETIFLPSRPELACVSSSMVRELESLGLDASPFLPGYTGNTEK